MGPSWPTGLHLPWPPCWFTSARSTSASSTSARPISTRSKSVPGPLVGPHLPAPHLPDPTLFHISSSVRSAQCDPAYDLMYKCSTGSVGGRHARRRHDPSSMLLNVPTGRYSAAAYCYGQCSALFNRFIGHRCTRGCGTIARRCKGFKTGYRAMCHRAV